MPSSSARLVRLCLLCLSAALAFSSCSHRYYKQRVMFQLTDAKGNIIDTAKLRTAVNRVAKNYLIQPNDYLAVEVYTNKGERLLDPNGELPTAGASRAVSRSNAGAAGNSGATIGANPNGQRGSGSSLNGPEFLVQADGTVVLPLINKVKVSGLSLLQADSLLRTKYNTFYVESFVRTSVTNNRVFMLGSPGGRVIPLLNDNMNLLEVLALAGGLDGTGNGGGGSTLYRYGGKANNIRIIRGDLKHPQIQQIDLTTLDGMQRANLQIEPNDVIYVEPVRRPLLETLTDASPVLSAAAVLLNATVIVVSLLSR